MSIAQTKTSGFGKNDVVKADLNGFFALLDEKSRVILWHLWWNRHAEISELRPLIDAAADFEIISRINDIINEKARKFWGRPVASFEKSKIDPVTGDKVQFSWWFIDGDVFPQPYVNDPLVDVFNDKAGVTVIAQIPTSVNLHYTEIECRNGLLKVRLRKEKNGN